MYRSARISGWILLSLGWLLFVSGLLFMIFGGNAAEIIKNNPQLAYAIGGFIAFPGLIFVALGEGLKMLVEIGENTKSTGEILRKLRRRN